jgi:protein SCO1/2
VDPERDTPEVLRAYMAAFDPGFLGLYADSPEKLAALAQEFKVYYRKVEGQTPSSYTMDHTAGNYLFDPQGRLRLYTRYQMPVDDLAEDIRRLLRGD